MLFGWHHHGLASAAQGGGVARLHNTTEPLAPAFAEDLCDICVALHHQSAAPFTFFTSPMPAATESAIDLPARVFLHRVLTRGFEARAPPAVERTT